MTYQSSISPPSDRAVLKTLAPLREAGFALHWLHPRTKRPIGNDWSNLPVAGLEDLRRTHAPGNNLGVRLGEPSAMVAGGYLHTFDMDIRVADAAEEAFEAFRALLPDVDLDSLPTVASGSGGASRHAHFITDVPFFSKRLAVSPGKHRSADGKWHYDWEIELFGTGKQVVLPPSIHPDTGQPYRWVREFDFSLLSLGVGPFIPASAIEHLATAATATYEYETREPLTFAPGELARDLDSISISDLHYDDWIRLGQALHHQFGGSQEGFDLWLHHTKRSKKYVGERQDREMRRSKWRSFGKYRGQPVTMGTVRAWAIEERRAEHIARLQDVFEEEPEFSNAADGAIHLQVPPQQGAAEAWTTSPRPPLSESEIEAMLGGGSEPIDAIDAIGTTTAAQRRSLDWMSLLDVEPEKGAIRPTLHNLELIIKNDPRLVGLPQINEFTQETVQRVTPGTKAPARRGAAKPTRQLTGRVWEVQDTLNGDLWSDDRDFAIRTILEAPKTQGGYGVKVSDRDLKAAVTLAASDHAFHPVREYLDGLAWDGTSRIERLFTDYLGAADDAYSRDVARLMMIAGVTRIYEPGHKFDFAVILEGLQGRRKSTFIRILGRKWFAELDGDFHDSKQMIELMQGAWILEIPELSGLSRADVRSVKAFISRQVDKARLAYARRAGSYPRQCIFIGSTNDREYLKDDTGGRRFWPMECTVSEIDTERLEREVDQLWAEAVVQYREMRSARPRGTLPLYLREGALRQAEGIQESRRVETEADALAGRISAWLDTPINNGGLDDDGDRLRDRVCLSQIWVECLGGDIKAYGRPTAIALGAAMRLVEGWLTDGHAAFPIYGKQRVYVRGRHRALAGMKSSPFSRAAA